MPKLCRVTGAASAKALFVSFLLLINRASSRQSLVGLDFDVATRVTLRGKRRACLEDKYYLVLSECTDTGRFSGRMCCAVGALS